MKCSEGLGAFPPLCALVRSCREGSEHFIALHFFTLAKQRPLCSKHFTVLHSGKRRLRSFVLPLVEMLRAFLEETADKQPSPRIQQNKVKFEVNLEMDDLQRRARWRELRNGPQSASGLEAQLHRFLGYLRSQPDRRDHWEQQIALVRRLMSEREPWRRY
jgi:hypothetical protein